MSPEGRNEVSVLLAGPPRAGKTTYLALTYLAISHEKAPGLSLGNYKDDREYLNGISKRLLAAEEARHTEVEERGRLSLSLEVGDAQAAVMLQIPDLSGETWEVALYDRTWPKSLDGAARKASGAILFLHTTFFDASPSIATVQAAERALGESRQEAGVAVGGDSLHNKLRYRPTQVQVVDLLQLLCEERGSRPSHASIILSAWDLTDQTLTPEAWLRTNAPLAAQYIESNRHWLDASVWGVSAQGGSFRDQGERAELLAKDAVDRAFIVGGDGSPSTVQAPTLWAMKSALS